VTLWDLFKQAIGLEAKPRRKAAPLEGANREGTRRKGTRRKATKPAAGRKAKPVPIEPRLAQEVAGAAAPTKPRTPAASRSAPAAAAASSRTSKPKSMKARYEEVTLEMLAKYDIKVRRWRTSMSGIATLLTYQDGTTRRFLESPRPRTPLSMSIFLHEVGHHAIGLGIHKPRCLEEYLAWKFSLDTMRELGLPVTEKVETRMRRSMEYAVGKAMRRGIRSLPAEVMAYAPRPR